MKSAASLEEFRRKYGQWTSMSIHLGNDLYTLPPAPDGRLRRFVQLACDLAGKPLNELRVLDLGCGEAHYAIEFAMHGAEVVGIEYREESIAKARFAKDYLELDRLELRQEDVRNLSREGYALFDLVICSGIHHLDAPDVFKLVFQISEVCSRFAIFDTQVAPRPAERVEFDGREYHGIWFDEHDESADRETKLKNLWASIDNNRSFWLTPASLANLVETAGFTSFYECLNPHHNIKADRGAYVAMKGSRAEILTSPKTAAMGFTPKAEVVRPSPFDLMARSAVRFVKAVLPRPIATRLKRALQRGPSRDFREALKPLVEEVRKMPPHSTRSEP